MDDSKAFRKGRISGTLSVSMAGIGLLAVLCFHSPSVLTMPDVSFLQPLPFMRVGIHLDHAIAFLLGPTSIMPRHSKILGIARMSIVAITVMLGGFCVQVKSPLNQDYYLGLDYALHSLIVYYQIFVPMEPLYGRLEQSVFRKGWQLDAPTSSSAPCLSK